MAAVGKKLRGATGRNAAGLFEGIWVGSHQNVRWYCSPARGSFAVRSTSSGCGLLRVNGRCARVDIAGYDEAFGVRHALILDSHERGGRCAIVP